MQLEIRVIFNVPAYEVSKQVAYPPKRLQGNIGYSVHLFLFSAFLASLAALLT